MGDGIGVQFVPQGPCVLQNNKFCGSMFTPDPGALYIYICIIFICIELVISNSNN